MHLDHQLDSDDPRGSKTSQARRPYNFGVLGMQSTSSHLAGENAVMNFSGNHVQTSNTQDNLMNELMSTSELLPGTLFNDNTIQSSQSSFPDFVSTQTLANPWFTSDPFTAEFSNHESNQAFGSGLSRMYGNTGMQPVFNQSTISKETFNFGPLSSQDEAFLSSLPRSNHLDVFTDAFDIPPEAQAVSALVSLRSEHTDPVDRCHISKACHYECDRDPVDDCATFEDAPCFDQACPDRCEYDGIDITCVKPHGMNDDDSGIDLDNCLTEELSNDIMAIGLDGFSRGKRKRVADDDASENDQFRVFRPCFHQEHSFTGCVNPLDIVKQADPAMLPLGCCCDDLTHIPNPDSMIRKQLKERNHLPPSKGSESSVQRVRPHLRGITHFNSSSPWNTIDAHGSSSGEHSRHSSVTIGGSGFSPMTTPSPFNPVPMSRTPSTNFQCVWMNSKHKSVCNSQFESAELLQQHLEGDHLAASRDAKRSKEKVDYLCHWAGCNHGNPFSQLQHFKDHLRTHSRYKPCLCKFTIDDVQCGKEFSDKKALTSHQTTHTRDKKYKCEKCSKYFSHQASLNTHLRGHEATKQWRCKICGHGDNDRANLSRHCDTHAENRFSCIFCAKTFSKKANAMRHLKHGSCKNADHIKGGMDLDSVAISQSILERPKMVDDPIEQII